MAELGEKIDVAWVTCREIPESDPDEVPALAAMREAGLTVETLAWDDPDALPATKFSVCVLRSCWNYFEDEVAFRAWVDRVGGMTTLLNPPEFLAWNIHKGYLSKMEQGGIPTVPTVFLERGSSPRFEELLERGGWDDVVIKPAVSAGSFATMRFRAAEAQAAQEFMDRHLPQRDMMVQCFIPSVDTVGEKCLIYLDGAFTHAVIKQPRFEGDPGGVSEALPLGEAELALGEAALACASEEVGLPVSRLFYARVDIVEHEGRWVVSELELLEPSLYLLESPPALERFVGALANRRA